MQKPLVLPALIVACTLSFVGCKSSQPTTPPAQQPAAQNSSSPNGGTLNSDGSVAPAQPPQQPVQQSQQPGQPPAQTQAAAAPPPTPPAPIEITAPAGTRLQIRTTETLSASHNDVGDGFTGVLDTPLMAHGSTLFARGTRVTGTVVASKGRGHFKGSGALAIEVNTIAGMRVHTNEYEREVKGKGKRTGGLIGGGAGLGAIIGGLAGGGKGAVIGGLAGAGAGTAGAAYTGNKDVVIPSESLVTFHLTSPLTLTR